MHDPDVLEFASRVTNVAVAAAGGPEEFARLQKWKVRKQILTKAMREVGKDYPTIDAAIDNMRTAFSIYRTEDNVIDVKRALEDKTVQLGYDAVRRVGVDTRRVRRDVIDAQYKARMDWITKHSTPSTNGKDRSLVGVIHIPKAKDALAEDVKITDVNEADKATGGDIDFCGRYRAMADAFRILPCDAIVSLLMGASRATPGHSRRKLISQGYEFAREKSPIPGDNNSMWRVVKNGDDISMERMQAEEQRQAEDKKKHADVLQALTEKLAQLSTDELARLLLK